MKFKELQDKVNALIREFVNLNFEDTEAVENWRGRWEEMNEIIDTWIEEWGKK